MVNERKRVKWDVLWVGYDNMFCAGTEKVLFPEQKKWVNHWDSAAHSIGATAGGIFCMPAEIANQPWLKLRRPFPGVEQNPRDSLECQIECLKGSIRIDTLNRLP